MAETRSSAVTFKGSPVTLAGRELRVGDTAPDFLLQDNSLADVRLSDLGGKTRVVATVPSLDTSVCSVETKNFNESAKALPNAAFLVVSMDLPFAQKRWCGAEGVQNVVTLSGHRDTQFGEDYGVLISGGPLSRILARAVFVVNPEGKIVHVEYVKEVSQHPNYDAALEAIKSGE